MAFGSSKQAKGIYKPHYGDYALSVRQTLGGPYADKEVTRRPDGSWVYPYFQENPDPKQRDREANNRGLVKCMEDGMPVGVLLQTKPKPGVEYAVLGLAAVTQWQNGYFILEGFSHTGRSHYQALGRDAAYDRTKAEIAGEDAGSFNLETADDLRLRQIAEVVRRRGQAKFRQALLAAHGGQCQITGCNAVEALEAAHIAPYKGDHTNHVQNGLLLRADLHSLFDLGLFSIDPATMKVVISKKLTGTHYEDISGRKLSLPEQAHLQPNRKALAQHYHWAGL